jgi:cytochrome b involved in lipid metabolism
MLHVKNMISTHLPRRNGSRLLSSQLFPNRPFHNNDLNHSNPIRRWCRHYHQHPHPHPHPHRQHLNHPKSQQSNQSPLLYYQQYNNEIVTLSSKRQMRTTHVVAALSRPMKIERAIPAVMTCTQDRYDPSSDHTYVRYMMATALMMVAAAATETWIYSSNATTTRCDDTSRNNLITTSSSTIADPTVETRTAATTITSPTDTTTVKATSTTTATGTTILSPPVVAKEDFEQIQQLNTIEELPIYTIEQLADQNGENGKSIWMSYGGIIYDVTNFVQNHPGGSEKIMMAAGTHIEPFWYLYRQHYNSDLPMRLMEHMAIGRLSDHDQNAINEQLEVLEQSDPYSKEPLRHKSLIIHGDTPMNAEVPSHVLLNQYITPTSLFYIRHHHPVPFLTEREYHQYRLHIDLSHFGGPNNVQYTIDDLKQMEPTTITVTLQCSGNRRSGFNFFQRTSGTPWGKYYM